MNTIDFSNKLSQGFQVAVMSHNNEKTIGSTIQSVLACKEVDSLLISDDASTDGTRCIVEKFENDPRVKLKFWDENLGQSRHWKWCLEQCEYEIFSVVHGDDQYIPKGISSVVATFNEKPDVDLIFAPFLKRYEDGRLEHKSWEPFSSVLAGSEFFEYLLKHNITLPSASFIRGSFLKSHYTSPNLGLDVLTDRDFFLRNALRAKFVAVLGELTTIYLVRKGSVTDESSKNLELFNEFSCMEESVCTAIRQEFDQNRSNEMEVVARKQLKHQKRTLLINLALMNRFTSLERSRSILFSHLVHDMNWADSRYLFALVRCVLGRGA